MAFRLPLRFKQALAAYQRHIQARGLPPRAVHEATSSRTQGGWLLRDQAGDVARVRADGTVLMEG